MQSTNHLSNHQISALNSDPKDTLSLKSFEYSYDLKEAKCLNNSIVPVFWARLTIKGYARLTRDGSCDVTCIEVYYDDKEVGELIRGLLRWDWIEKSITAWVKDEVFPEFTIHTHLKTA